MFDMTTVALAAIRKADSYSDPEVKALEARLQLLLARDAGSSVEKMEHTNRALQMIQQAVTTAPDNIEIHRERLLIHTHLPSFFADSTVIQADRNFLKSKGVFQ